MPTRLKRPSPWRGLLLAAALITFQGYLATSVFTGQFGVDNSKQVIEDIGVLEARAANLQAEIDAYRHRVTLFDSKKLDPDLLTERARALMSMARADEIVVMTDPRSGKPLSGSTGELASDKLTEFLQIVSD